MAEQAAMKTGSAAAASSGWLYNRPFDTFFIFGTVLLGLLAGASWFTTPAIFTAILVTNLWLLGYHHVIATFTRMFFDKASFRRTWWMMFLLMPVVFGGVFALTHYVGIWIIATIYLYAQWFHYSRQSWGVSRAYERTAPQGYVADRSWQTQAAFYSFPVFGILYRSWQNTDTFLMLPLKVAPVPYALVVVAGCISFALFAVWVVRVYVDWKKGVLPVAYTCFMFSHFFIFTVGYLLMPTLTSGWIVVNVWHNLQYMLFVWMFNNRNYRSGIDPKARFLSFLSQKKNVFLYILTTLTLTFMIYMSMKFTLGITSTMTATVGAYMTLNFHHYIVDAIIWRRAWIQRGQQRVIAQAAA